MASARTPWIADSPIEWDVLRIKYNDEGEPAPGVATVEVDREHKVDEKEPNGANGGYLTIGGRKLAKVSITLRGWNARHLRRADAFLDALFPDGKAKPRPFDVAHPVLTHHKLKSLFFKSYKGPKFIGDDEFEIHLDAVEFVPPPPTPPASATTSPGKADPGAYQKLAAAMLGPVTPAEQKWQDGYNAFQKGLGPDPGPAPRPGLTASVAAGPPLPPKAPKP